MQVKHIARIGLASWRAAEQEWYFTIRPRLFSQIIINNQNVLAMVCKKLGHGYASIRRDKWHWGGVGCSCQDNCCVIHSAGFLQFCDNARDFWRFLANGDINTFHILAFLIYDGINSNGGFTCLAVADNKLALTASDWNHSINGFNTCLHWLAHWFAGHYARSDFFNWVKCFGLYFTLAVNCLAQSVHHTAD